jgi:hypothetical protein
VSPRQELSLSLRVGCCVLGACWFAARQPVVYASLMSSGPLPPPAPGALVDPRALPNVKEALPTLRHVMRALNAERDADAPVGIPALPDKM